MTWPARFCNTGFSNEMTNMTASSNTNTARQGPNSAHIAFFSRGEDSDPVIEFYRSTSPNPKAPLFSGKVGDKRMSMFLRHGVRGPFLGLVGGKIEGTNQYESLGTANVITSKSGAPRLVMRMGSERLFCSVSKNLDDDLLVRLGLDLEIQQQKREAAAAESKETPAMETPEAAALRQLEELTQG
jgi:hypothetical protein